MIEYITGHVGPLMFAALAFFLMIGYPVTFSLGAIGLSFGSGSESDVLEAVFHNVKDKLYPADFVVLPNGEPRWRNQAQNMIDGLIEDGIIVKKNGKLWLR